MLGQVVFDSWRSVEDFDTLFPEEATRFLTVNGQRVPTIQMRPGEVQRWRLVHAGYQDDLFLRLERHALRPIARDGISLSHMGELDDMLIVPGQRIDVLVQAGTPGTYELRALPYDQGYPSPTGALARVVVAGDPLPMSVPAKLPLAPLATIRDDEITGTRQLTLSKTGPEVDATSHWQEFRFFVDNRSFDPNRVDQRVRLGAVEEWTVSNLDRQDHAFHIHTNPFQLTKVNGQPVDDLAWLDTVIVPRQGSVTFRSRFLDFTGRYVLHCHMMNHEELGMMQIVEVSAEG